MIADYLDAAPPSVSADFGFHHDYLTVKICRIFLDNWHIPPDVTLRQDSELLYDIIRDVNLKAQVERAREDHGCQTVGDVLEWMGRSGADAYEDLDDTIPMMRFG